MEATAFSNYKLALINAICTSNNMDEMGKYLLEVFFDAYNHQANDWTADHLNAIMAKSEADIAAGRVYSNESVMQMLDNYESSMVRIS